jgi:hypothetical protein
MIADPVHEVIWMQVKEHREDLRRRALIDPLDSSGICSKMGVLDVFGCLIELEGASLDRATKFIIWVDEALSEIERHGGFGRLRNSRA